jgi:hypothetical protein
MNEAGRPGARLVEIGETFGGKLGSVLGGAKQRLGISVVIANPGAQVRGFGPQPIEHHQRRYGLQGRAVVAVQHLLGGQGGNECAQPAPCGAPDAAKSEKK